MKERMKLLNLLWDSDINSEMLYKANPKLLNQFQHAESEGKIILLSARMSCLLMTHTATVNQPVDLLIKTSCLTDANNTSSRMLTIPPPPGIPVIVIIGESELAEGKVKIRDLTTREEKLVDR